VKSVLISVYVLCGLLAGVAGIITSGRLNAGSPTAGNLAELDSIAAVIIGGASFLGGRGTVLNAVIGALMIGVIRNGMNLLTSVPSCSRSSSVSLSCWPSRPTSSGPGSKNVSG